jgi:hypothetical protein
MIPEMAGSERRETRRSPMMNSAGAGDRPGGALLRPRGYDAFLPQQSEPPLAFSRPRGPPLEQPFVPHAALSQQLPPGQPSLQQTHVHSAPHEQSPVVQQSQQSQTPQPPVPARCMLSGTNGAAISAANSITVFIRKSSKETGVKKNTESRRPRPHQFRHTPKRIRTGRCGMSSGHCHRTTSPCRISVTVTATAAGRSIPVSPPGLCGRSSGRSDRGCNWHRQGVDADSLPRSPQASSTRQPSPGSTLPARATASALQNGQTAESEAVVVLVQQPQASRVGQSPRSQAAQCDTPSTWAATRTTPADIRRR